MRILIAGSGMYVTGRNGTGTGTVLSSLAQSSAEMGIEEVVVVSKSGASGEEVTKATARINALLGTSLKVSFHALGNEAAKVIASLHKEKKFDACIISI